MNTNICNKLVLGTVQFGVNYGINNPYGQVSFDEVCKILKIASDNGIRILDTSSGYGESEMVLGRAMRKTGRTFDVVSKYPTSNVSLNETFKQSLEYLGLNKLYGYLVHHFEFFITHPNIYKEMLTLKLEGKIQKIGFSLYTIDQLNFLINNHVDFDIVQFPYNIFDRQFEPIIPKLVEMGVEIHTRSAFLQGLFFMNTNSLPEKLRPLKVYLDQLQGYCKRYNVSTEQIALGYVISNPNVKGVLIGVDNHDQLALNIHAANVELKDRDIDFIRSIDIKHKFLLNPVNW